MGNRFGRRNPNFKVSIAILYFLIYYRPMSVYSELPPRTRRRVDERLAPPIVRARMWNGINRVERLELQAAREGRDGPVSSYRSNELIQVYQATADFATAVNYGESGLIDWGKPPVVGVPERRYLTVMGRISDALANGDSTSASQILRGVTAIRGTDVISGGIPCNSEVLFTFIGIKELQPLIDKGLIDQKTQKELAELISGLRNGFIAGERVLIARSFWLFQEKAIPLIEAFENPKPESFSQRISKFVQSIRLGRSRGSSRS